MISLNERLVVEFLPELQKHQGKSANHTARRMSCHISGKENTSEGWANNTPKLPSISVSQHWKLQIANFTRHVFVLSFPWHVLKFSAILFYQVEEYQLQERLFGILSEKPQKRHIPGPCRSGCWLFRSRWPRPWLRWQLWLWLRWHQWRRRCGRCVVWRRHTHDWLLLAFGGYKFSQFCQWGGFFPKEWPENGFFWGRICQICLFFQGRCDS